MGRRNVPKGMIAEPLAADELRKKGAELADVVREIERRTADWKEKSKAHREIMEGLSDRALTLAEDIESKTELRDAQMTLTGN